MKLSRVAVSCVISRGAFSDERIFEIRTATGEPYCGVASKSYCWTPDGRPLQLDNGHAVPGIVAARLLKKENAAALVSVPGGDFIQIALDMVIERPAEQ